VLVYTIYKYTPINLRYFLIIVGLLSFCFSEYLSYTDAEANFYLLHTRAWELIAGSICSTIVTDRVCKYQGVFAFSSFFPLITTFIFYDQAIPTHEKLIPVLLTCNLILFARRETTTHQILSHRSFVFIGSFSYSAYLIDQPLLAYSRNTSLFDVNPIITCLIVAATFPLAYLQNYFIENRFRTGDQQRLYNKKFIEFSCATGLFILAFGLIGELTKGLPQRPIALLGNTAYTEKEIDIFRDECLSHSELSKVISEQRCHLGVKSKKIDFLLMGDSFSASLSDGVDIAARELNLSGLLVGMNACLPLVGIGTEYAPVRQTCDDYQRQLLDYIEKLSPSMIILHANWSILNSGEWWSSQHSGEEFPFKSAVLNTIIRMKADQRKIFVVCCVPTAKNRVDIPQALSKILAFNLESDIRLDRREFMENNSVAYEIFKSPKFQTNATLIDLGDHFCHSGNCELSIGGIPMFFDNQHLNSIGSKELAPLLKHHLEENLVH